MQPVWQAGSQHVADFEILLASLLDRSWVDMTLRVPGFFRDVFTNLIRLFNAVVQATVELDEAEELNPLTARVRLERQHLKAQGTAPTEACRQVGWWIFGAKPGAHGVGAQGVIGERLWETCADLAEVYLNWNGYAYGAADDGTPVQERFAQHLERLQAVLHNQDNHEHDLLDSNDYYQLQGSMLAAVETLHGAPVTSYHGDHSQPGNPRTRTLKEEFNRVVRVRATNPKWIAGMKHHGYKDAFELAATIGYLCVSGAISKLIDDHQYALLADAHLPDTETRGFVRQCNPQVLRGMAGRLVEAQWHGFWQEPGVYRKALKNLLLDVEEE